MTEARTTGQGASQAPAQTIKVKNEATNQESESQIDPRGMGTIPGLQEVVLHHDGAELVAGGGEMAAESVSKSKSDHSLPVTLPAKSDKSLKPKVNSHSKGKVLDFKQDRKKVNSHSDGNGWKKSRLKPGYLIARIKGYDIVESEYGVSYLFVVTRKPEKRTSGDFSVHEHAGFSTWQALEVNGRLTKGASNDRISRNRTRAS